MKGKRILQVIAMVISLGILVGGAIAEEVDKGKIPADQLDKSFKQLAWGAPIWDVDEAVTALKGGEAVLWVDTRPESFFKKGTVRDAVLLIYNKKGMEENTLTSESLEKALTDKGISKDSAKIVFFCQGPKCHRSYNAAFVAVTDWGYKPENIVWFRAGYPLLFKAVQGDAKLKRKAKKFISDDGLKQL
jgi:hypothetical protein